MNVPYFFMSSSDVLARTMFSASFLVSPLSPLANTDALIAANACAAVPGVFVPPL